MIPLDKIAFEKLFKAHFAELCHYAQGMIGDFDHAKDIVQQAYIKIWQKRTDMDVSGPIKSYLYTSVRNASINHIRDRKKYQSSILDIDIYDQYRSDDYSKELSGLTSEELANKIRASLLKIPEKSLEIFKLSRFENMKYREIAEKKGVTVKTVEAHMSKALRILREELKAYLIAILLLISWGYLSESVELLISYFWNVAGRLWLVFL